MDLASKKCIPCSVGTPKLHPSKIEEYMKELPEGWEHKENPDRIVKEFNFKNFKDAVKFIDNVALIAEKEGHHPNLRLHSYKFVEAELYTHKIGGLHDNDFILASKIEALV